LRDSAVLLAGCVSGKKTKTDPTKKHERQERQPHISAKRLVGGRMLRSGCDHQGRLPASCHGEAKGVTAKVSFVGAGGGR